MKLNSLFCLVGALLNVPALYADTAEIFVKWKNGTGSDETRVINATFRATPLKTFREIGWEWVRLRDGVSLASGLALYRAHPAVLSAEPNRAIPFRPSPPPSSGNLAPDTSALNTGGFIPDDPRWSSLWNLRKINMPAAWQVTRGATNIVVAVIDSGVDYTHEDLHESMWRNPGESGTDSMGHDKATNQIDDDQNGYIDDLFGIDTYNYDTNPIDEGVALAAGSPLTYHGTGCAGIISATLNNATGIAGVGGSARIMAIRIFGRDNGREMTAATGMNGIMEAFNYVIMMKRRGVNIRVTSNSWGWIGKSTALEDALRILGEEQILSIFAAGNDAFSNDLQWWTPLGYNPPELIAVAATDQNDALANFSNWGRTGVDLAAPGVQILTLKTNNIYITDFTGTSAACPHVAGAAALLLAIKPDATALQLKAALMQSVDQIAGLRSRVVSNGRLNVARALEALTNSSLPPIVTATTPASSHTKVDAEIQIRFSLPMNRHSVESSLVVLPPISGLTNWSSDSTIMSITKSTALLKTNYSVRLLGSALDTTGRSIDGDFDRTSEGSPADDFVWSFSFAPPNDNFADAFVLSDPTGTLRSGTTNTTLELEEPLAADQNYFGASTIWYQWRATDDGWMTFDTSQSSTLDSIIAIYTGTELTSLNQVAYSDGFGSRSGARVSFPVQAGTNYFICVAGQTYWGPIAGYIGSFTLSWYPTPPPAFTLTQFVPRSAVPEATVTLSGTNFTGATAVLFGGVPATFVTGLSSNHDVRITAKVPSDVLDGPLTIQAPYGSVTSSIPFSVTVPGIKVEHGAQRSLAVSWRATTPLIRLQSTPALPGEWAEVNSGLVKTNGWTYFHPSALAQQHYYRLVK